MLHDTRLDPRRTDAVHEGASVLSRAFGVCVRSYLSAATCDDWVRRIYANRAAWTVAWGGEQFSFGRAFYTDFESDRTAEYFARAAASNALVDAILPAFGSQIRGLLERLVGGRVTQRHGWCGPGVHIFPRREKVARRGGVIHFVCAA